MLDLDVDFLLLRSLTALLAMAVLTVVAGWRDDRGRPERRSPGSGQSAFVASLLTALLGVTLADLGIEVFAVYGWALFIALPILLGFVAVLVHTRREPRSVGQSVSVALLSLMMAAVGLVGFAIEGAICIAMAAPLAAPFAALGGWFGWLVQQSLWRRRHATAMLLAVVALAPLLMGAEAAVAPEPPLVAVETEVEVDAPPAAVWRHVVSFAELPPPEDWLFRAGIAYPMRAEIRGTGPGAVRHCVFSTGAFVEPIEIWDEPRLLRFSVTENPPILRELSPWGTIHPPHLTGFLTSRKGEFRLEALPGGRTRLVGTTWYQHDLWPSAYWRLWSDWIIHRIHRRVLEHVVWHAEQAATG